MKTSELIEKLSESWPSLPIGQMTKEQSKFMIDQQNLKKEAAKKIVYLIEIIEELGEKSNTCTFNYTGNTCKICQCIRGIK